MPAEQRQADGGAAAGQPAAKRPKSAATSSRSGAGPSADPCEGVFREGILSRATELREEYKRGEPYGYLAVDDLVSDELLRGVREEVINHLQATYKETDLFKMFQTGDLANLDRLDEESKAKLPCLLRLRRALASQGFRDFASAVTGCGELSDSVLDGAANVHAAGGHLLCHDDVIGSRAVSFILYLVDPDTGRDWGGDDGGRLELYPRDPADPDVPSVFPTASVLPKWNRLAMFAVQPGVSFHSIQEVTTEATPRLSIQGWLHAHAAPAGADKATLQQLQAKPTPSEGDDDRAASDGPAAAAPEALRPFASDPDAPRLPPPPATERAGLLREDPSAADLTLLSRFVNPAYLKPSAWPSIRKRFAADGSVQLRDFLSPGIAARISTAADAKDAAESAGSAYWRPTSHAEGELADAAAATEGDGSGRGEGPASTPSSPAAPSRPLRPCPPYSLGVSDSWKAVGPAFKQRFLRFDGPVATERETIETSEDPDAAPASDPGPLLLSVQERLFAHPAFARLLHKLTDVGLTALSSEVRRFRAGSDYTVAHYGLLTRDPRLDAVLTFVTDGDEAAAEAWTSGEVGGFEAYLLADEDDETAAAAETYRRDDEQESGVLNVSPATNTLSLVLRDEGLMRFVKYLSAQAPSSRWDICAVFRPEPDDESDDEAGEGGADAGEERGEA